MNRLEALLRHAAADLERLGAGWALVGGLAVSVRSEARFTRDIDLAVSIDDDDEAEQLIRSLVAAGYRVLATVEQETVGRLATVRLGPPGSTSDDPLLDLLFASSGIEPEIVAGADSLSIVPNIAGPVARVGHLIAVKLLACDEQRRPQDLMDLRALRAVADPLEWEVAGHAVGLITDRGFSRGRDLGGALDVLLHQ
ncbi:MAG: nucleotidyl transferase AbiEii/AbiGii toxin family protein [Acidimicrobiales bacterium]